MLPFWATMSKQRSTLSNGRNFNAKLVRHCCSFWQQSRTLLRHCCWCGRGFTADGSENGTQEWRRWDHRCWWGGPGVRSWTERILLTGLQMDAMRYFPIKYWLLLLQYFYQYSCNNLRVDHRCIFACQISPWGGGGSPKIQNLVKHCGFWLTISICWLAARHEIKIDLSIFIVVLEWCSQVNKTVNNLATILFGLIKFTTYSELEYSVLYSLTCSSAKGVRWKP